MLRRPFENKTAPLLAVLALMLAAHAGCASTRPKSATPNPTNLPAAEHREQFVAPAPVGGAMLSASTTQERIAGRYRRGDGMMNEFLDLRMDGTCEDAHHGCLGVYGSGRGTWFLEGDRIVIRITEESGFMRGWPATLRILEFDDQPILVEPAYAEHVLGDRPSRVLRFGLDDSARLFYWRP
jgi:hypothetical protein